MFIGHFAVAFAAKKAAPAVSLGTLILAAQLADLVWPTLVLAGIEVVKVQPGNTAMTPLDFVHYPWSHSLVALCAWAIALVLVYRFACGGKSRALLTLAALVLSHWVLDVASHRPDMPVTLGGSERLGLGLWDSVPATVLVEVLMFAAGIALYTKATRAIDRTGTVAFRALVAFLLVMYFGNIFGPPPPSVAVLAWTCQGIWLLVAWGWWIDRHRVAA
jgi:hypothetical protein